MLEDELEELLLELMLLEDEELLELRHDEDELLLLQLLEELLQLLEEDIDELLLELLEDEDDDLHELELEEEELLLDELDELLLLELDDGLKLDTWWASPLVRFTSSIHPPRNEMLPLENDPIVSG
jgi:hypothetical protein